MDDLIAGSGSSTPSNLTILGSQIWFTATSTGTGTELWRSSGSGASTLVADLAPGAGSALPDTLAAGTSRMFFYATSPTAGREFFTSDGTSPGTVLLRDIGFSATASSPYVLGGTGRFALVRPVNPAVSGADLWLTDGTEAGTRPMSFGDAWTPSSILGATPVGSRMFFQAGDTAHGSELWVTDGTGSGATLLRDIEISLGIGSAPSNLTAIGDTLYFTASTLTSGREVYRSDGTPGGTVALGEINPGNAASNPSDFARLGDQVYFAATKAGSGTELWKVGVNASTPQQVAEIDPGPSGLVSAVVSTGSRLFFLADDGTNGYELWSTDGAASPAMVANLAAGSAGLSALTRLIPSARGSRSSPT